MEPNATPVAPAADGAVAPQVDNYGFPVGGDMSTDNMSDAELEAFVDKTLGVKGGSGTESKETEPKDPAAASVQPVTPPAEVLPPPPAPEPEPVEPVEVPDLDTSDLWLEVKDTNGDTVRLTLDEGVPDDFLFANDKQLYEVLDAFQEMKQLRKERESTIEKALADKATAEADQKTQQSTMDGWSNEIQDLVEAGLIEKSESKPADGKQFTPAEIAADPGLKLTSEVFNYMKTENAKRQAAGKNPLTSFTAAFTLYKKEADASGEAEALKQKNLLAKQRGSIVGGASAPSGSDKPFVYKRGSARNIHQVDTSDI